MSNKLIIRIAEEADAALLANLGAVTFREAFAADNNPEDMEAYMSQAYTIEMCRQQLSDPNITVLIAESAGNPIGYAMLRRGEPEACVTGPEPIELVRLYLRSATTGQGQGSALMNACLENAKSQGAATIWLGVWERNDRAIRFYRKWGYEPVGSHIFQLGADPQTDLIMQRGL